MPVGWRNHKDAKDAKDTKKRKMMG